MRSLALTVLGLAIATPSFAGQTYLRTTSEFKGNEDGYKKQVQEVRLGYADRLDDGIDGYIELGQGVVTKDGEDFLTGKSFTLVQVGARARVNEKFEVRPSVQNMWKNGDRNWEFKVDTRYKF
tara:strand:- start:375 stop:743 length:369 start_codon:yes stop_codon:yes gene_type:complete